MSDGVNLSVEKGPRQFRERKTAMPLGRSLARVICELF